jgi:hypothetical protein
MLELSVGWRKKIQKEISGVNHERFESLRIEAEVSCDTCCNPGKYRSLAQITFEENLEQTVSRISKPFRKFSAVQICWRFSCARHRGKPRKPACGANGKISVVHLNFCASVAAQPDPYFHEITAGIQNR